MSFRLMLYIALGFGFVAGAPAGLLGDWETEDSQTLETTDKSKALDRMLEKNGFAVTSREYRQMFSAYIPDSAGGSDRLPPFITTDSAWHTYHVLLEEGIKQLEQRQAMRLKMFSRRLLRRAAKLAGDGQTDFSKIADYASIALAIQDKNHAATLAGKQKELLAAIKSGRGSVSGPVGFPLLTAAIKANSFYTSSRQLANYFAARQWYAMVVFRLNKPDETSLAIRLAMLIDSDKSLGDLWRAMSDPYDSLLGKAEDGDVKAYTAAVRKIVGRKATPAQAAASVEALQKHLQTALPDPQISDQAAPIRPELTRGFRLLPPRRTTSSVCFQKNAPLRAKPPLGLHFMVACKQMRSPAAVRALQQSVGDEKARKIEQFDPGKLPDSLHGRAMQIIATLQKPPPDNAPKALKTQAWSDKQLWTQLGAWAQQRHTWALHAKLSMFPLSASGEGDAGMVSPYPEFFKSLGTLTSQTAKVLADAGKISADNVTSAAQDLLAHTEAYAWHAKLPRELLSDEQAETLYAKRVEIERMADFLNDLTDGDSLFDTKKKPPTKDELLKELRTVAQRIVKTGKASKQDMQRLEQFTKSGGRVTERMGEFAAVCNTLASIADQQLAGKKLNARDNGFLLSYGPILARCSFYDGNSWMEARDDSPIIAPIFVDLYFGKTQYAAVGRPRELYVKGKLNGETTLMRGAVLNYCEFNRPLANPLDDQSWRKIVQNGTSLPPPPDFTKSFIAYPSDDEIIEMLGKGKVYVDIDRLPGRKITQALIKMLSADDADRSTLIAHLQGRGTKQDAPVLIKLMLQSPEGRSVDGSNSFFNLVELIAKTPCESAVKEVRQTLASENPKHAFAAAYILASQPELIDSNQLTSGYNKLSTYKRALRCLVLGHLPKPGPTALATMIDALNDRDACLRRQGAVALGRCGSKTKPVIEALTKRIIDSNTYVAGAALQALSKLNAPPNAALLLEAMKQRCTKRNQIRGTNFAKQAIAIQWNDWGYVSPAPGLFDSGPTRFVKIDTYQEGLTIETESIPADLIIVDRLVKLEYKPAAAVILKILNRNGFAMKGLGFAAISILDSENYVDHMVRLSLNSKAPPEPRVIALSRLAHYSVPAEIAPQLIPLLNDKTPFQKDYKGEPGLINDLTITVIGGKIFKSKTIPHRGVFDDDGTYSEDFEEFRELVRKWAKTTTQPAGK
jgi:hypothetical protein